MPERIFYKEIINKFDKSEYKLKPSLPKEIINKNNKKENYWGNIFNRNKEVYKVYNIPSVPELEVSAKNHRDGNETNIPEVLRSETLPLKQYVRQVGRTCGLTSFRMIMGALGKQIPTYEQIMGKPANEINGSYPDIDHRNFLNKMPDLNDVKETVIVSPKKMDEARLSKTLAELLSDGNYIYIEVNWTKLHGKWHPSDNGGLNHGIVVHGLRETASFVQGSKINFLITDPNSEIYHAIWIPSHLLRKAMIDQVGIFGYKIEKPSRKEKVIKAFTKRRPLRRLAVV